MNNTCDEILDMLRDVLNRRRGICAEYAAYHHSKGNERKVDDFRSEMDGLDYALNAIDEIKAGDDDGCIN